MFLERNCMLNSGDSSSKTNKLKDWVFVIQADIQSKSVKTISNILLSLTRTTIPKFKTFNLTQNYKRSSFYIKALDSFQDNVRFSIFEHILNLKHCRVFETKPTFSFLSIILNSK